MGSLSVCRHCSLLFFSLVPPHGANPLLRKSLGFLFNQFANASEWMGFTNGGIRFIDYAYGATAVSFNVGGWGAVTLGNYISGGPKLEASANNSTFQHEYGHYIQSQEMGWEYTSRIAIPSITSTHDHGLHPVELDANRRAIKYFANNVSNFSASYVIWAERPDDYFGWDFSRNRLSDTDVRADVNADFGLIHSKWYDYLAYLGGLETTLIEGLSLSIYYNSKK